MNKREEQRARRRREILEVSLDLFVCLLYTSRCV